MSAAEALLEGRRVAESLMLDTCRITRRTGELVTDPETGEVTNSTETVYEGKCKVQSKDSATANPEAGGAVFTVVSRQVHIPFDEDLIIKDGDEVTITAADSAVRMGKVYRVEGFTPDTYDTAFRLPVKENL